MLARPFFVHSFDESVVFIQDETGARVSLFGLSLRVSAQSIDIVTEAKVYVRDWLESLEEELADDAQEVCEGEPTTKRRRVQANITKWIKK